MSSYSVALFLVFLSLFSWWPCCIGNSDDDQQYDEGLKLKHLPDGRVFAHFEHVIRWNIDPSSFGPEEAVHHYGMFPKALAEIVGSYQVQELHLSLTRGKWRTTRWGYPPLSSPPGAELWVWFLPDTQNVDKQWKGLVNGVSGLMCTSLSSISSSSTFVPPHSFRPHGAIQGNLSSSFLRYSALPREAVCTENLTPWSKLLPCGQKAGLGSLYAALKLYDSEYHSISLHFKPVCQDSECIEVSTELYQTLSVVFKPSRVNRKTSWSLKSLFTRSLSSHCPLAKDSKVLVDVTGLDSRNYTLTPPPNEMSSQTAYGTDSTIAVYYIDVMTTAKSKLDIALKENDPFIPGMISPPVLHVQRYITGSGLERGGIVTEITNLDSTTPLSVLFLDMVPWYLRVLLHTMNTECIIHQEGGKTVKCPNETVISRYFLPAKDRERPYTTEIFLSVPPMSRVTHSVQFLRAFLMWDEYPPDASHGFYVNSAVLTTILPTTCLNCSFPVPLCDKSLLQAKETDSALLLRIHTEPLLVLLPTPDFSMPYNVICFVSTVVAIGFGSIFNLTTKTLKPEDTTNKRLLSQLLSAVFKREKKPDNEDRKKND